MHRVWTGLYKDMNKKIFNVTKYLYLVLDRLCVDDFYSKCHSLILSSSINSNTTTKKTALASLDLHTYLRGCNKTDG